MEFISNILTWLFLQLNTIAPERVFQAIIPQDHSIQLPVIVFNLVSDDPIRSLDGICSSGYATVLITIENWHSESFEALYTIVDTIKEIVSGQHSYNGSHFSVQFDGMTTTTHHEDGIRKPIVLCNYLFMEGI